MGKRVELSKRAYESLLSHPYLSESVIKGIVEDLPRDYTNKQHFEITFKRKKNHCPVSVTILVHEKSETYLVYGIHSRRI